MEAEKNVEKVIALKDGIVEECRKQGLTLNEFDGLKGQANDRSR